MGRKNREPWDQSVYQTGITQPPKKRRGCMTVLLVLVILLGGAATLMGLLNIRLFRAVTSGEDAPIVGFLPENSTEPEESTEPTATVDPEGLSLELEDTPQALENIPQEGGLSLQEIYEKASVSVVSVSAGGESCTGVVLSREGYIVASHTAVTGAALLDVTLPDGRTLPATLIGSDEVSDLALIRVGAKDLVPAQFGDSEAVRVGDLAVSIGDPMGTELRGTMTDGIVAAINRDVTLGDRTITLFQTTAVPHRGGPLLNCYGQVVGIHASPRVGNAVEGISLAIPSTAVKELVDQLAAHGRVVGRPRLGLEVQSISPFDRLYYRLPQGLYITDVVAGSDAANKDIQAGDILLKLNGRQAYDAESLRELLFTLHPGDTVELTLYRNGSQFKVNVILMEEQ